MLFAETVTFVAVVAVSAFPVTLPVILPTNEVEVVTPLTLIPPDPVINLLFRSRLPPNCGVVSSTTLLSPPPPPPPDAAIVNPPALTLLKVILLPAVIKISSSVLPSLNLKFTLLPDATDD